MRMHSCISDVADFRTACRLPIAREPELRPEFARLRLLTALIDEETLEIGDAVGSLWSARNGNDEGCRQALAEVADGLADLIYVAVGAALELGIPLAAVWAEVHRSNLAKAGAPKDAMGKQTKPENWTPPDVFGAVFGKGES